jgi:hypothetical protein
MKQSRLFTLSILFLLFAFLCVNCGSSRRCVPDPVEDENKYIGYLYVATEEDLLAKGLGLTVLLTSIAPEGYGAVKGAKIYSEVIQDMTVYTDANGRFEIDLDSISSEALSRSNSDGIIQIIVEPPAELANFPPIRHMVGRWKDESDLKNTTLHPNARYVKVGQMFQFQTTGVTQDDKNVLINPSLVTWQIDDADVGEINSHGVFKGLQSGVVTVTATYDSLTTSGKVFVHAGDDVYNITGMVTDKDNNPVPGIIIAIDRMDSVSRTKADGSYGIAGVSGNVILMLTARLNGEIWHAARLTLTKDMVYDIVIEDSPVTTTSIHGRVTSADNGEPVEGVLVTIGDRNGNTDDNGNYLIEDILVGTYPVTFDKSGYVSVEVEKEIKAGFTVVQNVVLESIPVTTGTLNGRVIDSLGDGIPDAVVIYTGLSSLSRTDKIRGGAATTDINGNFSFTEVSAGDYRVSVSSFGYITKQTSVTITAGEETNKTITLQHQPPPPTTTPAWQNVGTAGFSAGQTSSNSFYVYDHPVAGPVPYVAYKDAGNGNRATVMKYDGAAWEKVGFPGFSAGEVWDTSLYIYNDPVDGPVPYIAYRDGGNGNRATVMKYDGTAWEPVGLAGFSDGEVWQTSLYVYNGTPYVAYRDLANGNRATVMKYDGAAWEPVGLAEFSPENSSIPSLYVYDNNGTPVPYVAYRHGNKPWLMRFNGVAWENVGDQVSANTPTNISLYVYDNIGTPVPYVAYRDGGIKATVRRHNGTAWENVGTPGFSAGSTDFNSLYVYDDNGTPVPYVAYSDGGIGGHDNRATVMKFNGTAWEPVGIPGFSAGTASGTSLYVYDKNGTPVPYVAYMDGANGNRATVMKFALPE